MRDRAGVEPPGLGRQVQLLEVAQGQNVTRRRQPRHRVLLLAADPERRPAGDDHRQLRGGSGAGRRRPAALDDLLEVVEHEQAARFASQSARTSRADRPPLSTSPRVARIVGATRPGSRTGSSATNHPVREALRDVGRELERQPGLAGAAGPGQRQQPRRLEERLGLGELGSRPTKLVSWVGRLFGRRSSERIGGKSARRPLDDELKHPLRPEVLEAVLAEPAQPDARRQLVGDQARVVSDTSTWPPCPAAATRAARLTSARRTRRPRRAGRRRYGSPSGPGCGRRPATARPPGLAARRRRRRRHRPSAAKTRRNRRPRSVLDPAVGRDGRPDELAMPPEDVADQRVDPKRLGEAGRALDVGEDEGDGPGRQRPSASKRGLVRSVVGGSAQCCGGLGLRPQPGRQAAEDRQRRSSGGRGRAARTPSWPARGSGSAPS